MEERLVRVNEKELQLLMFALMELKDGLRNDLIYVEEDLREEVEDQQERTDALLDRIVWIIEDID